MSGEHFYLVYAHLLRPDDALHTGDSVFRDDPFHVDTTIGIMGDTGGDYPCHLHFGVLTEDPMEHGDFEIGSANSEPFKNGFSGYSAAHPSLDCRDLSYRAALCFDVKDFVVRTGAIVAGSGVQEAFERPGVFQSANQCIANLRGGQAFVTVARYSDVTGSWGYVTLPSLLGPNEYLGNSSCSSAAPFAWVPISAATPLSGLEAEVSGTDFAPLKIRYSDLSDPGLARGWPSHSYWTTGADPLPPSTTPACLEGWLEIVMPSERFGGQETGWICRDSLELRGGYCPAAVAGELQAPDSACTPTDPPTAPEATTVGATDATQASVTLNASVDPNGAMTATWFEWGPTTSLGFETVHVSAGSGTTAISLSQTLSGLACETTYRFRAQAENSVGPSVPGNILTFTTAACDGGGAQSVELIRNGDFLANGQYWNLSGNFQADQRFSSYHFGPGYAYLALPDGSAGNGLYGTLYQQVSIPADATSADLTFWTKITTSEPTGGAAEDFLNATLQSSSGTFLASLREYSNRDASSSYVKRTFDLSNFAGDTVRLHFLGLTNSDTQPTAFRIDDVSLQVEVPAGTSPTVVTSAPDQITESSARLRGTVNPNGLATDVWFDLEAGDSTPDPDTEHFGIGSGTSTRSISYSVFDLECGTTYWVEAIGSNSEGTVVGAPRSFQTSNCPGTPPRADTRPADGIEAFSARLNAEIWPEGSPTTAWFEWGTTPTLGNAMNPQSAGSVAGTSTSIERTLTGLACGTLYYFEAHAQNGAGVDDGATLSFSTVACPGPPETSMPLWVSRQGCAGPAPAVRLEWDMPPTADPIVQIERLDVGYIATVDTRDGGPKYIVQSGLVPVGTFEFRIHGTDSTVPIQSNVAVAYVYLADCDRQVAADELPHQPLAQATAFCEGGIPKILVEWTPVLGAETYAVYRYGALGPNAVYEGVVATQLVDSPLSAGMGANYQVRALNGVGQTSADMFGVLVPGDICGAGASPGPFTVSVTQEPYCDGGYGRFNWARSTAANALANYRWFGFNNSELETFDDTHTSSTGNMTSNVGDFRRVVVQAESSSVPGQYREARSVARILPADLCGAFANPPTATISTRKYVDATSAVVIGTVRPAGSPTEAHFEWGLTTGYGSTSPSHDFGRAPVQPSRIGELFTGLSCGTDYHFRLVASNANGTGVSNDLLVSTRACPPNSAPIAAADEYWVDEDVELVVGAPGVLGNDSDPEGSPLVTELLSVPSAGSLVAFDSGAFTYQPDPNFWGTDSFSYRASDGLLTSSAATVTIHVAAVEEPPEIFNDGFESGDMAGWSLAVP